MPKFPQSLIYFGDFEFSQTLVHFLVVFYRLVIEGAECCKHYPYRYNSEPSGEIGIKRILNKLLDFG